MRASIRRNLATVAALATVAGLGVVGATPALAIPESVTSLGPGSAPSSLVVAWTTGDPDSNVYIGIAKATTFSPSDPCTSREWNTEASIPANLVGYFYQGLSLSNPREVTSYLDWNTSTPVAVEPSTVYVACYFKGTNDGSGSPVVATAAPAVSSYTITFDGNGSTSGTVPTSGSFTTGGTAFSVPANTGTLAKTDHTFSGWNTAANGTGTAYAAGSSTISPSANTTLYAQWTANATAGGGSSTPEPTATDTPTATPTATPIPVVVPVVAPIPPGTNANIPAGGLTPGSSVLLVNGVASTVTIKPDQPVQPKSLIATGDGFNMEIAGQDASGKPLGLTNEAALRLERDNTIMVKGSGFAPNVDMQVNIFSTATLLGTIRTDATGAFNGTVRVPANIEPGRHTLQVGALTADNKVRTLSLGVVLEAPAKAVRTAKAAVSFDPLSTALTPKAKKALLSLAKKTKATATGGLVVGYVQRDGNPANNASLSKQRARAIARFLKANGVTAPLTARGNGVLSKKETGRIATVKVSYTVNV